MRNLKRPALLALLVGLLCFSSAHALPLQVDPSAISGSQGLSHYSATVGLKSFSADVAYAAFDSQTYRNNGGIDPSWGQDKYVYAYQIFNSGSSTVAVNYFAVSMLAAVNPGFISYDWKGANMNSVASSSQEFVANGSNINATWRFGNRPFLLPEKHSLLLVFTSDWAPSMGNANIKAGDFSGNLSVVVPQHVPEPLTLSLLGCGLMALVRNKKK